MGDEITAINSWSHRLRGLLDRYKDVSPLSRRIHGQYRNFLPSKFVNGISQSLMNQPRQADGSELTAEQLVALFHAQSNQLEVCLMTPAQRNHPDLLPNSLYYRKEWGSVMADSLQWSDAFLAAITYHEFGHALRHRVDAAPSATAPGNSDLWISEEVEMHELEYQVLDMAVQGRFSQQLDRIIDRVPESDVTLEFYRSVADAISAQDWQDFDNLFGLRSAGPKMTSIHCAQFLISLGFRCIERLFPEQERRNRQIEYYRFVTTLSQR
jgi:hypothetical protein